MNDAHIRARQPSKNIRNQLELTAEKLLELETLDEKIICKETASCLTQIQKLHPSESTVFLEENKRALEKEKKLKKIIRKR